MAIEAHGSERFESPQVSKRAVLLSALGFLLLLASAIGMLQAVYYRQVPLQQLPAPEKFPQPRVQAGEREQLQQLEAEQTSRLTAYQWVDRKAGLVQIPIERAMQLLAVEGMQAYAPLARAEALSSPTAGAERLVTPPAGVPPPARTGASPPATPAPQSGAPESRAQPPSAAAAADPASAARAANADAAAGLQPRGSAASSQGQRP